MVNRFEEIACDLENIVHPEIEKERQLKKLLAQQTWELTRDSADINTLYEELHTVLSALIGHQLGPQMYDYACALMNPILQSYKDRGIIHHYSILKSADSQHIVVHVTQNPVGGLSTIIEIDITNDI